MAEEASEKLTLNPLPEFLVRKAAQVVESEIMRLLERRKIDCRMLFEEARQSGRSASRRADDEYEPIKVSNARRASIAARPGGRTRHYCFRCAALVSTRTVTFRAPCKLAASGLSTGMCISPMADAPSTRPGKT